MIPLWLGKFIATRAIKAIKYRIDLKRIDKYVNKPKELDIQMKQIVKTNSKILKENEEMQKDIAEDYLADQQSDEMKIAANANKTDADLLDSSGDDSFDDLAKATFIKKK